MKERKDDLTREESELLGVKANSLERLRKRHSDCPPHELLLAARAEVLPEELGRRVAEHLGKCRFCQILVHDLADEDLLSATTAESQRIRDRVMPPQNAVKSSPSRGERLFRAWMWPAGSIALAAVAIALAFWLLPRKKEVPTQPLAEVHQAPTAAPPFRLEWEKLPIKLDASLMLVPRGAQLGVDQKYAAELTSALVSYRDDNFAQAAERLADVARNFPQGKEGQLYLGISELKLERNAEAILPLQRAQDLGRDGLHDDATWYLALAYERVGRLQDALTQLENLCRSHSSYKDKACKAVGGPTN